jgi:hypothetical protein
VRRVFNLSLVKKPLANQAGREPKHRPDLLSRTPCNFSCWFRVVLIHNQRRIAVVGNGNIGVGNKAATRKPGQQMAGAMSQQSAPVMGDNQSSPQKFVRLVGYRDPKVRSGLEVRPSPNPVKR